MRSLLLPLLLAAASFMALPLWSQNNAPVVSNVSAVLDSLNHKVTVQFDLADTENDPMEIWLRVSGDDGRTWRVPVDSLSGDVGYPIAPGTGKTIQWLYDQNALSTLLGAGNQVLVVRVSADDHIPMDIAQMLSAVDSARMMGGLAFLEGIRHRSAGPAHHQEVRDSLSVIRDAVGLQDWNYSFNAVGLAGHNLIGRKYGLQDDAPTWYISAHFDSEINTPGVDDNASGTIAVMEAMQVLSQYNFKESIRFMAFDLEEDGLLGSFNYVQNHVEPWESVEGVLNMEMIGYYSNAPGSQTVPFGFNLLFPDAYAQVQADSSRGNFLTNVSNTGSEWLMRQLDTCASLYVPSLRVIGLVAPGNGIPTPDLRRSDHASFWDAGHPALMLTDGANMRNPNYHMPGDSLGTIHPGFYFNSAKAVIATLIKQAQPIHAGSALSSGLSINLPVSVPVLLSSHLKIYPNPNDGKFHVDLQVPESGRLKVDILDAQGKRIVTLHDAETAAGTLKLGWDKRSFAPGNYMLDCSFEGRHLMRKISVVP